MPLKLSTAPRLGLPAMHATNQDHTPHWKRGGHKGFMSFEAMANPSGNWVSFDIEETSHGWHGERQASKRVMVTLDKDAVKVLRDLCNQALGE